MTREQAKQMLPIIKAYAEGKTIEIRTQKGWVGDNGANLDFGGLPEDYRIKPEPKYRPFENAEECWAEMLKHQPFGWVRYENSESDLYHVNSVFVSNSHKCTADVNGDYTDMEDMLKAYTFADGTPFGAKIEEE